MLGIPYMLVIQTCKEYYTCLGMSYMPRNVYMLGIPYMLAPYISRNVIHA